VSPEALQKYFDKSGDDKLRLDNLIEDEQRGFMSWSELDGNFVVHQVFGDGVYWDAFIMALAKQLKLKKIIMATKRNPKAFERKFNFALTGYILEKEVNYE